jgi:hypothetical protein
MIADNKQRILVLDANSSVRRPSASSCLAGSGDDSCSSTAATHAGRSARARTSGMLGRRGSCSPEVVVALADAVLGKGIVREE